MKEIKAGRPSNSRKNLEISDIKERKYRISADVDKDTMKALKQRALEEDTGVMELVKKLVEEGLLR